MGRKSEKYPKTKSNILPWYTIEGAVLMVQGSYLNLEHSPKCLKYEKTIWKHANNMCCYYNVEGAVFRAQGPYPNIENAVSLWNVIISSD